MYRRLLLLFALVTSSACAHNMAPTEDQLLTDPVEIVAPVLEDNLGVLALTDDGRWAFKTGDDAATPDWKRGQIVAFGGLDEQRRHLFVVLSTHSWGGFLQRIDSEPVQTVRSGSLVPLASLDGQVAKRWRVCAGTGAVGSHPCITDQPTGTRWDIYPADGARMTLADYRSGELVLPARRQAQLHVSSLGNVVLGKAPESWIAVPRSSVTPLRTNRVLVAGACSGIAGDDSTMTDIEVAEFAPPSTFFGVESLAYDRGADAFVSCTADEMTLHIPGLTRRGWSRRDGDEIGAFLTSFAPPNLPLESSLFAPAVRFAGSLAAGDIAAADFWLERTLLASEDDLVADLGRDAMQVAVEAGRVEGAIRQGSRGTSSQWNRENDPRWGLGFAAVEDALGRTREFVERRAELEQRASRAKDEPVLHAIYWYRSVETLSGSAGMPAVEKLAAALGEKDVDELKAAVIWKAAQQGLVTAEDAKTAVTFDEAGAQFVAAAAGDVSPLPCDADCFLDVYGRRFMSVDAPGELAARLARVGYSTFSPGYVASVESVSNPAALVALLPLIGGVSGVERTLIDVAVDCETETAEALKLARELPNRGSTAWFLGSGRTAFCSGLPEFIQASKLWVGTVREGSERRKAIASSMLDRLLFGMKDGIAMEPGAYYLAELGADTDACERWNVALAIAHLRAGRTESANRFTEKALSCAKVGVVSTRMSAFVNFDRTRSVSSSFEPSIRRAVQIAARRIVPGDVCVGTRPTSWVWGAIVPKRMEAVVSTIDVPAEEEEAVMLATATRTLATTRQTRADLVAAMRALDAKKAHEAMTALEADYAAIDFKPGLRRAAFIRDTLIGPTPAEGTEAAAPKRRSDRFRAWSDPESYLASDEARDDIEVALLFLLSDSQDEWDSAVAKLDTEQRNALCGLPETETAETGAQ